MNPISLRQHGVLAMNKRFFKIKPTLFAQLLAGGICLLTLVLLIIGAVDFGTEDPKNSAPATRLTTVSWETASAEQTLTLPHSFLSLSPRTPITLTMNLTAKPEDFLYIKSVYAPLKVYANGNLIYEYGQKGSYPGFLQDPATGVAIVPLPVNSQSIVLRMEYLSPISRDVLTVHPVLLGSESQILNSLFKIMGPSFGFSLIQIFMGILLILIALLVTFFERKGLAFLWLGLFAFLSGIWAFGECNLTGLLIHNPTLLYLFAFCGLFTMPIPLFYFGLSVIDFQDRRPMLYTAHVMTGVAIISLLLQLFGVVALSTIMYSFQILLMVSLLLFAGIILYEGVRYKSQAARRFFLPIAAIALFCVLEWVNYQLRFTNVISLFFQIGVMLFVLMTGIVGGLLVRDALRISRQKQQLAFEVSLMETQMAEQKKHYSLFLENAQAVKRARHDLRHQLMVIRSYNNSGANAKLTGYLDTLIGSIPDRQDSVYCENAAVNAIISHYATLAEKNHIKFSVNLTVPEYMEQISDTNLCVIFGNLLENATEACARLTDGHRFISLYSRLQYGTLTIVMDNSFDGKITARDGMIISRKRSDFGTGTNSVTTVAKKHGGGASFDADGLVFKSSVYVRI